MPAGLSYIKIITCEISELQGTHALMLISNR